MCGCVEIICEKSSKKFQNFCDLFCGEKATKKIKISPKKKRKPKKNKKTKMKNKKQNTKKLKKKKHLKG